MEQYGWFIKNHPSWAQPVALKLPNPFGLFDIHGNALEWCQDGWDPKWYEKSSPADPNGPSSDSRRMIRGGSWPYGASDCRSAFRMYDWPSSRFVNTGFRIVLPLDPTQPETAVATTANPNATPTNPTKPWETPAFQQWVKATQALPAEQQIEAVSQKLVELNPGFDGMVKRQIESGSVTELEFVTDTVVDISPVRALSGLARLRCWGSAPGKGRLSDLSPLRGMKIYKLNCGWSPSLADISPLQGMPLKDLKLGGTQVADISVVSGMNLEWLTCEDTKVTDLSPLAGRSLEVFVFTPKNITKGMSFLRQMNSLKHISLAWGGSKTWSPDEFWKKYDAGEFGDPAIANQPWNTSAFQQWVKATQALPAEKQIEAVSKKLMELNPGFNGKVTGVGGTGTPKIENGVVTELGFVVDNVIDISPVRALVGLKALTCGGSSSGKGKLSDLSPLKGLELTITGLHRHAGVRSIAFGADETDIPSVRWHSGVRPVTPARNAPDLLGLRQHASVQAVTTGRDATDEPGLLFNKDFRSVAARRDASDEADLQLHSGFGSVAPARLQEPENADRPENQSHPRRRRRPAESSPQLQDRLGRSLQSSHPQPNQLWNTPAFQAWMKEVQAMPAEKQIEAVSKKLMELNPGFDGKVTGAEGRNTPKIVIGVVKDLQFVGDNVADISPLRALVGLSVLSCSGTHPHNGKLSDLSPLQGMPLMQLTCEETQVFDLSPLAGMPLNRLYCVSTEVSDLSPLRGLPLTQLACNNTKVSDLTPLQGMKLTQVFFTPKNISRGIDIIRQMTSIKTIGTTGEVKKKFPPEEFWKKYDAGEFGKPVAPAKLAFLDPAFQQWMKDVAALPAEKQVEAVAKKLVELNPGFDGKVTNKIENDLVADFGFLTDNVTDISPVRALPGLKVLLCNGTYAVRTNFSDLSPLEGMSLTRLNFAYTQVSDLSPLKGMPLTKLDCYETQVFELSPLKGMPLTELNCLRTKVSDLSPLQGMPLDKLDCLGTQIIDLSPLQRMPLTYFNCNNTKVSDLTPLRGMSLKELHCWSTNVSDLSPLKGMPLTILYCNNSPVSNLSPLGECNALVTLKVNFTKVTAAGVAALQKALPNCKIDWDDPAKPKTPEPAASGTK